ncbi:MAG: hypothetical protein U0Q16_13470 [Bryobacteraceae bacterium]
MYRSRTTFLLLSASVAAMAAAALYWLNRMDPELLDQASDVQKALNRKVTPQQAALEALRQEPLLGSEYSDAVQQRREAIRLARMRPAAPTKQAKSLLSTIANQKLEARARANSAPLRVTDGIEYAGIRFASRAGAAGSSPSQSSAQDSVGGTGLVVVAGDGQDTEAIEIAIKDTVAFVAKGGAGISAGATGEATNTGGGADSALNKAFMTLGLLQLGGSGAGVSGSMAFLQSTYLPDGLEIYVDPGKMSPGKAGLVEGLSVASVLPFLNDKLGAGADDPKSATDDAALDLANLSLSRTGPEALLFESLPGIPMSMPLEVSESALPGLMNQLTSNFAGVDPSGLPGGGASEIDKNGGMVPVPEPSTLTLALTGLVLFALGCWRRSGRSRANH